MNERGIYIDPIWRLHTSYHLRDMVPYPPEGYRYIVNEGQTASLFGRISQMHFSYWLLGEMYSLVPLNLIKSKMERFKKTPEGTDLTFSYNHLIFRKEPWVIDMDAVWNPIGPSTFYFGKFKKVIERSFASQYCRKILCTTEFSRNTIRSLLDTSRFKDKLEVVPRTVRKREFVKRERSGKATLLFVGSANMAGEFEMRGGKEVLEVFAILSKKHQDLQLVIRSDISPKLRERYRDCLELPSVKVIDRVLPFSELETVFQSADIFLFPGHYEAWQIIMEAMSYELPVVTTNVHGASEHVSDGKTGFLVKRSEGVPYYQNGIPLLDMTSRFQRAIQQVDPRVVADVVEKTGILIEDEALRRKMGRAGRWEIEKGAFSLEKRNAVLKSVFDQALGV
jgi:glycosyltransferase involved in cell wall biosynthesis